MVKSLSLEEVTFDTYEVGEDLATFEKSLENLSSLKSLKRLDLMISG